MSAKNMKFKRAAYGGKKWSPRVKSHSEEIGSIWTTSGNNSEWSTIKSVLLHKPGPEINSISDPEKYQMLAYMDAPLARKQHDNLAQIYQNQGIEVVYVSPSIPPSPNLMFCADLLFMTPEGAILGRPASTVRAGEERWVARRLSDLGIPILLTITNHGIFEGADALWIDPATILIGVGLRTNSEAVSQIKQILSRMNVEVIEVDLPVGTMHLMGILRFLDDRSVLTWPYRLGWRAQNALIDRGYKICTIPNIEEADQKGGFNFVTIGPKEIVLAANNPDLQRFLEDQGVICHCVNMNEFQKAAGGIGCLTGVLERVKS
jgi:N-dimethylarginine dimethylaminohydrolase